MENQERKVQRLEDIKRLKDMFKAADELSLDEEYKSEVMDLFQLTRRTLRKALRTDEMSGTKYDEYIDEYVDESFHQLSVGEIVGEEFEGLLIPLELETIMRRVLCDFVLYMEAMKECEQEQEAMKEREQEQEG